LISTKHINQRRSSRKLANKYIGFLPIIEIIKAHYLVYRVKLLEKYRMHNAFSIGLLEPYNGRDNVVPAIQNVRPINNIYYEFEKILGYRGYKRNRQYQIRWKGCISEKNSWKSRDFVLSNAVQAYESELKTKKNQQKITIS
jgi:hypothetical protein